MAGPDAAADQGPAIKAVWQPGPPDAHGQQPNASRRRADRRRTAGRRRRRALVVGAALAIALGTGGYVELNNKGPVLEKGAATTILPPASAPSDTSQTVNSTLGTSVSLTNTASPSRSPHASASASATPGKSANAGASASPSPSRTDQAKPSPSPDPSASPSQSPRTCFLFICN